MLDGLDPMQLAKRLEYQHGCDHERHQKWADAAFKLMSSDPWVMMTIQSLGVLDSKLIKEDEYILGNKRSSSPAGDLNEQITMSYLWVLGAYEVVRTLDQRARENRSSEDETRKSLQQLKRKFERIRMPLAKLEAARRYKDTDRQFAFPGINTDYGTVWHVGENVWITRRELSDSMLELMEKYEV
ncbi:hypothetical protein [Thioalkalivibrio sp. ALJ3]|uniref:hypothetical protein n=1 Tax=Thioalkalivibrio sp. ALJ3 TaxID=1240557 RepID=UPI0012DC139F|nr:hypothetical protein [Thioalkalivibrio sp. ALJ3]